ncbi:outer membrane beta-barrel protein [Chthonobacter rhizosphaerae]|uniref:outer membrane beta-barrel protein n=1 Tax=Chthonobacter rhizosphaerae TaxID=2735553 RepID=UPI0015EFB80A|nr:outer membrane beta-barrel protein [Chthonobacter rhizosphaerae]
MRPILLVAVAAAGLAVGSPPSAEAQDAATAGEVGSPVVRPATDQLGIDDLIEDVTAPTDPGLAGAIDPLADPLADPSATDPAVPSAGAAATGTAPAAQPNRRPALRPTLGSVVRPVPPVEPLKPIAGGAPVAINTEEAARSAYEPLGLRVRTFTILSSATSTLGWSSNPGGAPDGEGAAFWGLKGDVTARSDLDGGGIDLALRGGVRDYLGGDAELEPSLEATADGRLDLTEVDRLTAGARYAFRKDTGFSIETPAGQGVDIHTLSATAGYARSAGLIGVTLKGALDRTIYDGDDRDDTALSGTLRLSLDSGAVLEPFAETSVFARRPDRTVDENGFRRSSVGAEAKLGTAVDTGLLTGEVAVGYGTEVLEDDRLDPLRGMILEASLAWAVTPLTTVTLAADTSFETSRLAGASGSITRSVSAGIAHALKPNLILDLGGALSFQDYGGVNRSVATVAVRAGAAWRLNPSVELTLTATHEVEDSNVSGEDTRETTVEAGVTVRR